MQLGTRDLTFVVEGNLVKVVVTDSATSQELGTPIRFKDSGGRIAADFPGVSDSDFITTGDHGGEGSITTG